MLSNRRSKHAFDLLLALPVAHSIVQVDNERLVGLLGETKEWKRVAKELGVPLGGSHYVPVEEALVHKVCV